MSRKASEGVKTRCCVNGALRKTRVIQGAWGNDIVCVGLRTRSCWRRSLRWCGAVTRSLQICWRIALKAFVRDAEKRRFAIGRRPRKVKSARTTQPVKSHSPGEHASKPTPTRHVPAAVAREVYVRDQGRCTFIAKDGRRCGCRMFLELDHAQPFAAGGVMTASNLRLRCRAHNQWHARRYFGRSYIQAAIARSPGNTAESKNEHEATGLERARSTWRGEAQMTGFIAVM